MSLFLAERGRSPRPATIGGDLNLRYICLARPRSTVDRDLTSFYIGPLDGSRNHGLHRQSSDWVRIFGLHRVSGFDWLIWKAITGAHEVTDELRVENFDLSQPFARRSTDPTGNEGARRKSMMLRQRRAIHVGCDQSIGVERFLDRDAANEWRHLARNLVESSKHDVLARRLHSGLLQNIAQAWSGKLCRAHRTFAPLNSVNLRTMEAASVARAFECVDDGMRFEFREIRKFERKSFVALSSHRETPLGQIEFARFVHMIAHEEMRNRSEPGIEILDRRLEIDKAVGAHDHSIFVGKVDQTTLREGHRPGKAWRCSESHCGARHL